MADLTQPTNLYSEDIVRQILAGISEGLKNTAKTVQGQADESEDIGAAILLDGTAKGLEMSATIIDKSIDPILESIAAKILEQQRQDKDNV